MIIKNNETENGYWTNNYQKYINSDKYKKDNEDENEYEKNQENKKNKSNDDDNDDENMIIRKIIKLI